MDSLSSTGKNLEAIARAIDLHDRSCGPTLAVLMNPFEVERLGWDEIKGVPIEGDSNIPTGRFHLVCDGLHEKEEDVITEAVSPQKEVLSN